MGFGQVGVSGQSDGPGGFQGLGPKLFTIQTLQPAQILALFTTPVQLLPAPGPGNLILVEGMALNFQAKGTPYTDGGGQLAIQTQGGQTFALFTTAGFWNQATSQIWYQFFTGGNPHALSLAPPNLPLVVSESVANPTGGNGLLQIAVTYYILSGIA